MEAQIKRVGNSYGIILPKEVVKQYGIKPGEKMEFLVWKKEPIDGFGMLREKKLPLFKREKNLLGRGW